MNFSYHRQYIYHLYSIKIIPLETQRISRHLKIVRGNSIWGIQSNCIALKTLLVSARASGTANLCDESSCDGLFLQKTLHLTKITDFGNLLEIYCFHQNKFLLYQNAYITKMLTWPKCWRDTVTESRLVKNRCHYNFGIPKRIIVYLGDLQY